jgi:serine/threonine-protein kinase
LCTRCAEAERALASAAASESTVLAALYPPGEAVEVLRPSPPPPRPRRDRRLVRGSVVADRYKLLERVGAGGTATVYRAQDLAVPREVALKVLHEALSEDEVATERFRREARSLERLQHPNIVRTFDHGVSRGMHYIAMEHVPGSSLKSLIAAGGPPKPKYAIEIVLQILAAAGSIHAHGLIHRDLKSANVLVNPRGLVKVTDFGIACPRGDGITRAGSLVGTVEYISPERLKGDAATESSDLYAIGVIFYELLTGRLPFDAQLVSAVALKHLHERPAIPTAADGTITPGLRAIAMRALEKAPEDRFPHARAFAAALRRETMRPRRPVLLAAA